MCKGCTWMSDQHQEVTGINKALGPHHKCSPGARRSYFSPVSGIRGGPRTRMTRGEEHNAKAEKAADERTKAVKERREI